MTDKSLKVYVGDDRLPVHDLTSYVDWPDSRFIGQAYNGESSVSSVVFRDENAQFGPWVDSPVTIAVRNEVEVLHGSNFLYRGRWIGRTWERGVQKAYQAREVTAEAEDVNVELRGLIVDGWVRPAETDRARVLALREDYLDGSVRAGTNLSTTYVSSSNTFLLPAKTYERTDPLGVLQDVAFQTHKQFFVTIDKELFYDGWDSGAYACPFRISDDPAELKASPTTTLGIVPDSGPLFAINGQRFIDGIRLYYGSGPTDYVDVTHPGLSSAKAHWRETVYAPESITNATEAANLAETILQERSQDGRTFMLSVCHANGGPLTDAQVGSIKPGMLISIKARVLPFFISSTLQPNYTYYTTRIVSLQWHMPLPGQYFATLKLERPERTFGVGVPPGPRPPGDPTAASCALDASEMTAISTPNGDFELGNTNNWTSAVLSAGDPQGTGGSWFSFDTGVGSGGWEYTGWVGQTFTSGQTYVVRVYVTGNNFANHILTFGDNSAGDDETLVPTAVGEYCIEWTPSANRTNVKFHHFRGQTGSHGTDNLRLYTGGSGDTTEPVGDTGDPGTDTGVYSPIDHVHAHSTFATGDYHTEYVREAILTTAGDVPYATGASTWTRLAIGASNFHLRSDGTKPVWSPEAGAALTNPMTTAGDIIKGGVAGTPERLAIGASNFHLRSDGTAPVWSPESASLTNPMDAVGDLIRGGAAGAPTKLAIGASNFALKSTGTIPEWSNTLRLSYIDLDEHTLGLPPSPPAGAIRLYGSNSKGYYENSSGTVVELGGAGSGSSGIAVEEDGVSEGTGITSFNFTTNLDVSVTGSEATISATGGGSGGGRGEYASKYNPDHETPATTPADAEEFNGSTGMSWSSAPGVIDDVTGYPGFYRFKGNTTERLLSKAWTPGATDLTLACKFSVSRGATAGGGIALYAGNSTGNPTDGVYALFDLNNFTIDFYNENASSFAQIGSARALGSLRNIYKDIYLRLTRVNSGPTWAAYIGFDGITWFPHLTTGSKSLTVGAFGLRVDADHDISLDWIRVWTSVIEKVGA
jgi:hypothetical protein